MKKIAIVMVVGLAVLLMTPAAVRTQNIMAPIGQPGVQTLASGCYHIYSITYNLMYGDTVYINIAPNGVVAGSDDVICQYPVSGKKTGADFVAFFDFPWETCSYPATYAIMVGTGLKATAYVYDSSGTQVSVEQLQLIPCWMVVPTTQAAAPRYFGQIER